MTYKGFSLSVVFCFVAPGRPRPPQKIILADSSNYGDRYLKDVYGKTVHNDLIIVLHETVISADATIELFQTPHVNDADQASYHALINTDGTIIYLVPPEKRAFGAANSIFIGVHNLESVKTNPMLLSSVNNFAYHISLETPIDGENDNDFHSDYTNAQYQSLGWLIYQTKVSNDRITTHYAVDRTGKRKDPRSFSFDKLFDILSRYKNFCE